MGKNIRITISREEERGAYARLLEGSSCHLGQGTYRVDIEGNGENYRLSVRVGQGVYSPRHAQQGVSFTSQQRVLLMALARHAVREGEGWDENQFFPSSKEIAEKLGWNISRFNRKLDNVCEKLARLGIDGMLGSRDRRALFRRQKAVSYAVRSGLVCRQDLMLLE